MCWVILLLLSGLIFCNGCSHRSEPSWMKVVCPVEDPLHNGLVFQTQDGAASWQRLENFTTNRLRSVIFVDDQRGFIAGDRDQEPGSLWRTTDGGRIWNTVDETYPDLHRIFPGSETLWAVGKEGTILKYDKN